MAFRTINLTPSTVFDAVPSTRAEEPTAYACTSILKTCAGSLPARFDFGSSIVHA
jgi:phage baseplate assembly protein W|eukprot:COSAG06_NODE_8637_length_2108_cov_12.781604_2_plen_55_part_00